MLNSLTKSRIYALLLAVVFLAAQFHFCADLSAGNKSAHFCPFCSTAGAAITTHTPVLRVAPVVVRLEVAGPQIPISTEIALSISPRAPPAF